MELYRYGAVAYREGGFGVFKPPPPPRNSEDIGGVLDRISKKNRRLDFRLQFTVFLYGCNLLINHFNAQKSHAQLRSLLSAPASYCTTLPSSGSSHN